MGALAYLTLSVNALFDVGKAHLIDRADVIIADAVEDPFAFFS